MRRECACDCDVTATATVDVRTACVHQTLTAAQPTAATRSLSRLHTTRARVFFLRQLLLAATARVCVTQWRCGSGRRMGNVAVERLSQAYSGCGSGSSPAASGAHFKGARTAARNIPT